MIENDTFHACKVWCDDRDSCKCREMNYSKMNNPEGVIFYEPPPDPAPKYQQVARDEMYRAVQEHCVERNLPFDLIMNNWLKTKSALIDEARRKMYV